MLHILGAHSPQIDHMKYTYLCDWWMHPHSNDGTSLHDIISMVELIWSQSRPRTISKGEGQLDDDSCHNLTFNIVFLTLEHPRGTN
jgi:hypothetical protein